MILIIFIYSPVVHYKLIHFQMPRNYKKFGPPKQWDAESLQSALKAIQNGSGQREAARTFGIPESTLRDRIKTGNLENPSSGCKPVLPKDVETQLTERIIFLSNLFYGLSPIEVRRIAFEYCELKVIENPLNKNTRLVGRDWLQKFLERNPRSSIR